MDLTNEQRRCLGLGEIPPSWDCVELEKGIEESIGTV